MSLNFNIQFWFPAVGNVTSLGLVVGEKCVGHNQTICEMMGLASQGISFYPLHPKQAGMGGKITGQFISIGNDDEDEIAAVLEANKWTSILGPKTFIAKQVCRSAYRT